MEKQRIARCSCWQLEARVTGEPSAVVACHCLECQRRSGSPFGVGAYFTPDQVQVSGRKTKYTRPADSGETFNSYFCPLCGSTLYWVLEEEPGRIGIALGAFADPKFPAPVRSVWEQSMHPWVRIECAQQHYPRGRDS